MAKLIILCVSLLVSLIGIDGYSLKICENKSGTLRCNSGFKIKVNSGYYGRRDKSTCLTNWFQKTFIKGYCNAGEALARMRNMCDNRRSCSITAKNGVLSKGEPCFATIKYAYVDYSCVTVCASHQKWNGRTCVNRCAAHDRWQGSRCVYRCPGKEWVSGRCLNRCPSHQRRQGFGCVDRCPAHQRWTGSRCIDRCTPDKRWDGKKCVDRCNPDQIWKGGKCVARCSPDQIWKDGKCVARCNPDQIWKDGKCAPRCNPDQIWKDGKCAPRCTSEQIWKEGKCVARCEEDKKWDGKKCVDRCVDSLVWDKSEKKCKNRCETGKRWFSVTKNCYEDKTYSTTGGNADGADCRIPFKYKGEWKLACVRGVTGMWCATTQDYDTDGKWGYC